MARVRAIEKERAAMILRNLYDAAEKQYGAVPNLFKTMAHRPELLLTFSNYYKELWTGGAVDARIKELAAIRAAVLNGCHY
ncbi:MAG: carboxymuconolactone decarboxylase family protein, partial [Acidobacteria bacterium]|nr:carboxymuconolactone decarboxylase family protein [Acidobacteriota bacterium]